MNTSPQLCKERGDLQRRLDAALEALRPFGEASLDFTEDMSDDTVLVDFEDEQGRAFWLTLGDFRRAQRALSASTEKPEPAGAQEEPYCYHCHQHPRECQCDNNGLPETQPAGAQEAREG